MKEDALVLFTAAFSHIQSRLSEGRREQQVLIVKQSKEDTEHPQGRGAHREMSLIHALVARPHRRFDGGLGFIPRR